MRAIMTSQQPLLFRVGLKELKLDMLEEGYLCIKMTGVPIKGGIMQ
jgi:hypothetical protein